MTKYRIKSGYGKHTRKEKSGKVTYYPGGEAFTPTEGELKNIGDKLEQVVEAKQPKKSETQDSKEQTKEQPEDQSKSKG